MTFHLSNDYHCTTWTISSNSHPILNQYHLLSIPIVNHYYLLSIPILNHYHLPSIPILNHYHHPSITVLNHYHHPSIPVLNHYHLLPPMMDFSGIHVLEMVCSSDGWDDIVIAQAILMQLAVLCVEGQPWSIRWKETLATNPPLHYWSCHFRQWIMLLTTWCIHINATILHELALRVHTPSRLMSQLRMGENVE